MIHITVSKFMLQHTVTEICTVFFLVSFLSLLYLFLFLKFFLTKLHKSQYKTKIIEPEKSKYPIRILFIRLFWFISVSALRQLSFLRYV